MKAYDFFEKSVKNQVVVEAEATQRTENGIASM